MLWSIIEIIKIKKCYYFHKLILIHFLCKVILDFITKYKLYDGFPNFRLWAYLKKVIPEIRTWRRLFQKFVPEEGYSRNSYLKKVIPEIRTWRRLFQKFVPEEGYFRNSYLKKVILEIRTWRRLFQKFVPEEGYSRNVYLKKVIPEIRRAQ
jgi:hypothetical protein